VTEPTGFTTAASFTATTTSPMDTSQPPAWLSSCPPTIRPSSPSCSRPVSGEPQPAATRSLTIEHIEALIDRTKALLDRAEAAWDHHPDELLGALAVAFVADLSREDLQALAVHCIVDHLNPEDDLDDESEDAPRLLN